MGVWRLSHSRPKEISEVVDYILRITRRALWLVGDKEYCRGAVVVGGLVTGGPGLKKDEIFFYAYPYWCLKHLF